MITFSLFQCKISSLLLGPHMWILGRFSTLVSFCFALQVYKKRVLMDCASLFKSLIGFSSSGNGELKNGFLVFGCFSSAFNLFGLFLLFVFGFVFLQFSWQRKGLVHLLCDVGGKPCGLRNGFSSKCDLGQVCGSKVLSCKWGSLRLHENLQLRDETRNGLCAKSDFDGACDQKVKTLDGDKFEEEQEREREGCIEDDVLDVEVLWNLVKSERRRADMGAAELEKERMAAASAAEEAMAMILRLQGEKSSIEIEANQYKRLAEQTKELDHEVVQSLQWIIMKHEYVISDLEARLRFCREKLKEFVDIEVLEGLDDGSLSFLDSTTIVDGKEDAQGIEPVAVLSSTISVN